MTKVYDTDFRSEQKYLLGSENFSILDHVNVFLLFKDHLQGNKFNEFRLSHSNLIIFTLVQCFITGLTLLGNLMMDKYHPSIPSSVSLYFGTICPLFLGWFIIILQLSLPKMSTLTYKEFIKQRIIPRLQDIWCLVVSISICLFTVATAYNGHCSHNEYGLKGFGCSHSSVSYMPDGLMLLSLLFPNIIFVLVQGAKWKFVLTSYVITIVFHVCTIGALQLVNSIPALVVFIFFTSLIMFENQRQNVHMFFMSKRIDALAAENVRLLEEEHAVEMRHMIANVAHDLKTPLTAFTSGLENIYGLADEMEGGLNSPTGSNREQMGDIITNIKNNIGLIKNINSFMVMTINRCIDYTKATNNVKLVPRCETFDLKDAMDLPLRCNRDIQDKIVIKLQPIGTNISPQIITDKQWFQENILCLLSNAVKYSTSGSVVVITVTLVPASAGPDDNSKEKSGNDMSSSRDPSSEDKFTSRLVFKPQPFDTKVPIIYSDLSKSNATEELSFQMRSPDLRLGTRKQLATEDSFEHSTEPTERYSIKRHSNSAKKLTAEEPPSEDFRSVVPSSTDPPQLQPQPSISDLCKYEYSFSSAHSPQLRVEVEDTGIGMTDAAMETLFKPFKQAQRLAGGTGLGLYSLAKRVEALKGTYGVMNRRDGQQGSVFWFSIPYKPDKAKIRNLSISAKLSVNVSIGHNSKASMDPTYLTELSQSGSPSSMAASSLRMTGGMQKLNILIVDDSLSILKMSSMLLRRQGHTITTAENGAEAVQKIFDQKRTKHTPYDVVLMDLQMPVMDGLEATRRLRQSEEKVALLSAIASPQGSFRSVARSSDPYEIMEIVDANSSGHTRSSENKSFIRRKSTLPLSNSAGIAGTTLTKQSFTNSMNNSSSININSSSGGIPTSSEHRSTGNRGRTSSSGGSGVVSPGSPLQQSSALLSIGSTPRNSNPNNPNNASNAAAAAAERNRHMMSQQSLRAVTRAKEAEELKYDHMSQLVIGVSANSDAETVEEAFRAGVDAFIPKPFTLESFNKTYLNLLEMKMIDTMIENDVSNRENNKVDNKGLVKAVSEALLQQANTQQQQQTHQKENLLQDV